MDIGQNLKYSGLSPSLSITDKLSNLNSREGNFLFIKNEQSIQTDVRVYRDQDGRPVQKPKPTSLQEVQKF